MILFLCPLYLFVKNWYFVLYNPQVEKDTRRIITDEETDHAHISQSNCIQNKNQHSLTSLTANRSERSPYCCRRDPLKAWLVHNYYWIAGTHFPIRKGNVCLFSRVLQGKTYSVPVRSMRSLWFLYWPCVLSCNYSNLKLGMLSTENLVDLMNSLLADARSSLRLSSLHIIAPHLLWYCIPFARFQRYIRTPSDGYLWLHKRQNKACLRADADCGEMNGHVKEIVQLL